MVKSDSELFNAFGIETIYDDYASFYNESCSSNADRIRIASELSTIHNKVKEREAELIAECQKVLTILFDLIKDIQREELVGQNAKNRVLNCLLSHFESNNINSRLLHQSLNNIDYLINEIDKLSLEIDNNETDIKIAVSKGRLQMLQSTFVNNHNHEIALWRVTWKIISGLYPEKLPYFDELSEDERTELRSNDSRVGAPPNKNVPQDKVEQIVNDLLENSEGGVRVETSRDGKKMMFQVVHDKGKRKGRANINQIFKYFEFAHPNLLAISDRQFVKRIKKAVPEGMK